MTMVDSTANEAALRYLAAELERAYLNAAQLVGNLALTADRLEQANQRIAELEARAERAD